MALHVPRTSYQSMMKDGARHFKGLEEAVFRNIKACKDFAQILRSSFGPQGMNKIVVNHLDKRFVTSDTATIMNELDVQHPAAKIIVMSAKMQEQEVGDGTNMVVQLAAELLNNAETLIRMGLTPNDVADGYKLACSKALELLKDLCVYKVADNSDFDEMKTIVETAIFSKQAIHADTLSSLVTEACLNVKSKITDLFNIDSVSTVKILGAGIMSSQVVKGLVFTTGAEGRVTRVKDAKIAVFTAAFDLMATETKGTVLLNTASQLSSFTTGEEQLMSKMVQELKEAGINLVITSDKTSHQALDCANRHGIMVLRISSKFDLQRICRATTAVALPVMRLPSPEELGHCKEAFVTEYGNTTCCVLTQEREESTPSTIILRGSSMSFLDDVERAIDDGVNAFKMALRENTFVSGAGSTETFLASQIVDFAKTRTDITQYSVEAFGEALEVVPKILAENAGFGPSELMSKLHAQQVAAKSPHVGVAIFNEKPDVFDTKQAQLWENAYNKCRAIMLATHAATTILSVDQIIMAKPAGGPRVRAPGPMDQD